MSYKAQMFSFLLLEDLTRLCSQRALNSFFEAEMEKVFEVQNPAENETCPKVKRQRSEGNPTTDWYVFVPYPHIMRYWINLKSLFAHTNIELL